MTKAVSVSLSLAAAFALVACLFGYLPATIYSGSSGEFSWPLSDLLVGYLPWAAGLMGAIVLISIILPRRISVAWAVFASSLASAVWAHSSFVIVPMPLLDGQNWTTEITGRQAILDLLFCVAVITGFAWFSLNWPERARVFLIGLAFILMVQTAIGVGTDTKVAPKWEPIDEALFRFSPEKNALVILLDGMQSDVFEEVINSEPDLAAEFGGFTFYPDTAGVSTTTYLAMPTIHSGNIYDGKKPLKKAYSEWVVEGSFLTKLADAGYHSMMINAVMGTCPARLDGCHTAGAIVSGQGKQRVSEGARLLDVGLLRVVPAVYRGKVYNDGKWTLAPYLQGSSTQHFAVEGNSVLDLFRDHASSASDRPTVKFMHLFNTHLPIVMNKNCEFVGETVAFNRDNFRSQVSCAVKSLTGLFASMRNSGVYDKTAIMVMADHGTSGLGSAKSDGEGEISSHLIGVANPTLAFKPIAANGSLRFSDEPMSLSNVALMVCGAVKDCGQMPAPHARLFNRYSWAAEYWNADTLPDLATFELEGPVWNPSSWIRR